MISYESYLKVISEWMRQSSQQRDDSMKNTDDSTTDFSGCDLFRWTARKAASAATGSSEG